MSDATDAAYAKARETLERLQLAYRRVFGGRASKEDQTLVLADLELFCNVRTDMTAVRDGWQVHCEVGKFRVWQRINGLRFPRPADARREFKQTIERTGGLNGEESGDRPEARPGRGIEEPTND